MFILINNKYQFYRIHANSLYNDYLTKYLLTVNISDELNPVCRQWRNCIRTCSSVQTTARCHIAILEQACISNIYRLYLIILYYYAIFHLMSF